MNKKYHIFFVFEYKNNIFVKINLLVNSYIIMLEEKFFAIFKSYINDLVDVAVKNTLKQYGFDEKSNNQENNSDKKKQEEQEKKYQEQEKRYQEQENQKQQNQQQNTKQETKKEQEYTKKTPFDEFKEQFDKYKKFSDKFEEDDKKTTDNNQKKTNDYQKDYKSDYQQKNQQKTTRTPTTTELEQQYYTRLGITSAATWEQIKAAYKSEMKRYHPDKYANEPEKQKSAETISQKINEAYTYFEKKFKK